MLLLMSSCGLLSKELLLELCCNYSDKEIAIHTGFSTATVVKYRKKYGIPSFTQLTGLRKTDGKPSSLGRPRVCFFDERYFQCINSEDKAYYLGLFAADATILKCKTKTEITLTEPDHHVLQALIEFIQGDNLSLKSVLTLSGKTAWRLKLCSKTMAADLINHGLVPSKTYTLFLNTNLDAKNKVHFLRGLWDGDGCIAKSAFNFGTASALFCNQMFDWITELSGSSPSVIEKRLKNGNLFYTVSVSSRHHHSFRQALYKDATIYLHRKYQKFQEFWN